MSRIPMTVVGGFLGAGKTTLVNRLLAQAQRRRLAVLVNDFGSVNIDASLVASSAGDTIELTNGCVCCSIGGDLSAALLRVLATEPSFDGIVVEASGVSDPWRIAQIALADPQLELDGVFVLVDASAVVAQARDAHLGDTMARQIAGAGFIVLNKTDLATADELQRARAWLDAAAPKVPRFETRDAELPPGVLQPRGLATGLTAPAGPTGLGAAPGPAHATRDVTADPPDPLAGRAARNPAHRDGHGADHAAQFETWTAHPDATLAADALRAALRDMPEGVLRLKGFVRTDAHGWSELQFSGRHGSLRRATAPPPGDAAALVAIGLRGKLPRATLDALVRAAAAAIA